MKTKTQTDNLTLARRIRDAGVSIYIPEDDEQATIDPSSGLLIYQFGGLSDSRAFDFYGGTGCIVYAVITVNLSRFAIAGFGLELPWKADIQWIGDPVETGSGSNVYRFDGSEFERDEVLNYLADVRRTLPQGTSVKGALLATGYEPIPEEFPHGSKIPAFLIVYDQFWRPYRSPIKIWTHRSAKLSRPQVRVRRPLFECLDPKPV